MNWKLVAALVIASGLLGACGASQQESKAAEQPNQRFNDLTLSPEHLYLSETRRFCFTSSLSMTAFATTFW